MTDLEYFESKIVVTNIEEWRNRGFNKLAEDCTPEQVEKALRASRYKKKGECEGYDLFSIAYNEEIVLVLCKKINKIKNKNIWFERYC